jgi:hypothetical protein
LLPEAFTTSIDVCEALVHPAEWREIGEEGDSEDEDIRTSKRIKISATTKQQPPPQQQQQQPELIEISEDDQQQLQKKVNDYAGILPEVLQFSKDVAKFEAKYGPFITYKAKSNPGYIIPEIIEMEKLLAKVLGKNKKMNSANV